MGTQSDVAVGGKEAESDGESVSGVEMVVK